MRFTLPSTRARTRCMFGFQTRLVCRFEWLTLNPWLVFLLQISQWYANDFPSRRSIFATIPHLVLRPCSVDIAADTS